MIVRGRTGLNKGSTVVVVLNTIIVEVYSKIVQQLSPSTVNILAPYKVYEGLN